MNKLLFEDVLIALHRDLSPYLPDVGTITDLQLSSELQQIPLQAVFQDVYGKYLDCARAADVYPGIVQDVAVLSLITSFGKKFEGSQRFAKTLVEKTQDCLNGFLERNEKAHQLTLRDLEIEILRDEDDRVAWAISGAQDLLQKWFSPMNFGGDYELDSETFNSYMFWVIRQGFRHGPGGSAYSSETRKEKSFEPNDTSFFSKMYDKPITTSTDPVRDIIYLIASGDPLWEDVLIESEQKSGPVQSGVHASFGAQPKSWDKLRACSSEPSGNMACQLPVGDFIVDVLLRETGLSIKRNGSAETVQQRRNQTLAKLGSMYGHYATLDLRNASDFPFVVAQHLTAHTALWPWLTTLRSQVIDTQLGNKNMSIFAPMGNGFTFAFETALFAALTLSVMNILGVPVRKPKGHDCGNFAVYGDDIIVPTECQELLRSVLARLYFEVNETKSFFSGSFRESCGGDYLLGTSVRPVYCSSLSSNAECFSVINRLILWSAEHNIFLPSVCRVLFGSLKKTDRYFVPPWKDVTAGLFVPFSVFTDEKTPCFQKPRVCPKPVYDKLKVLISGYGNGYIFESAEPLPKKRKMFLYQKDTMGKKVVVSNEKAKANLLLAILQGSVKGEGYALRQLRTFYEGRWEIAPCWDYLPPDRRFSKAVDGGTSVWITAFNENFRFIIEKLSVSSGYLGMGSNPPTPLEEHPLG